MKKRKNIIIGCIYKHPNLETEQFNEYFLKELSEKLLKEKNKEIILMGDFNIDLLKYEQHKDTSTFLDFMYLNALIPHITSPTRITPRSETLIDNIFSTFPPEDVRGGNLISSVSDHLAQQFFLNNTEIETSKKKMYQ